MKTLIHLPALGFDTDELTDPADVLSLAINRHVANFLFDISDSDITNSDIILGRDDSKTLAIKIADWNENLIHNLRTAVSILYAKPMDWPNQPDRCEKVAQAAADMANQWSIDAYCLVIDADDIGQPCAKTLLTPEQALSLKDHPEEWAFTHIFLSQSSEV